MTESQDRELPANRGVARGESRRLAEIADLLGRERPVPRAGFSAMLRRRLLEAQTKRAAARGRLRLQIAAYAGSGLALLAIAGLGVSGVGPLAPG